MLPRDTPDMQAIFDVGPNWHEAWRKRRDATRAVIVAAFVANGRNLKRTAQALGLSLSALHRFRREDEALLAATQAKPGRPSKGAANAAADSGSDRKRAVGE